MAWSSAVIARADMDALNSGAPCLLGHNAVLDSVTPEWRQSGSWASGADNTATGYPTSRIRDGRCDLVSCPTNVGTIVVVNNANIGTDEIDVYIGSTKYAYVEGTDWSAGGTAALSAAALKTAIDADSISGLTVSRTDATLTLTYVPTLPSTWMSIVSSDDTNIPATSDHYLLFDFGSSGATIDTVILSYVAQGITDYCDDANDLAFTIEISDNSNFASPALIAFADTEGDGFPSVYMNGNYRMAALNLYGTDANPTDTTYPYDARRYSGVRYLRLYFNNCLPQIKEVFIGRRYQLPRRPVYPYQPLRRAADWKEFESDGGVRSRYLTSEGQWLHDAEYVLTSTTELDNVLDWLDAINHGGEPFWFIEDGRYYKIYGGVAHDQMFVRADPALMFLQETDSCPNGEGPYEYRFRLSAIEQGGTTCLSETMQRDSATSIASTSSWT